MQRRALLRAAGAADLRATAAIAEEAVAGARAERELECPARSSRCESRKDARPDARTAVRALRRHAATLARVRAAPAREEHGRARDGQAAMLRVAQHGARNVEADRPVPAVGQCEASRVG